LNMASVVESSDCAKTMGNSTTSDSHFLKRERAEDKADGSVEFADSSISGCCSSKHVRVDDEADDYVEYVDSDCIKNKHVIELNSECEEGSSECGGNVIFENKEEINYNKKTNKGKEKEVQPTVHNTRRRTKS
ncbi:21645_t:CDS:1, partial [Gigaspora margarita]